MTVPDSSPYILIADAPYYQDISAELRAAVIEELDRAGCCYDIVEVPGTFELPVTIKLATQRQGGRAFDGFIALGVVIRGETTHYDYVCTESARKLQDLAVAENLAIGYGILTVENQEQAWARARRSEKNKGAAAARACLEMIQIKKRFGVR